ncbi:MAG: hypothetical protein KA713_18305 [Chryseotalea sp. WA131a]|nr:MAG: hypothetical protein KA713_18305 [Chryseotalea sp. WA131a]
MMKRLFYLLLILLPKLTIGQTDCHVDKLTGKWNYITSMMGKKTNVDSLKELTKNSKQTLGTWDFKDDGTFSFKSVFNKKFKSYKSFTYDKGACEIILGTKKDAKKNANLEIVFLNDKYLIYWSDNNPKTYYTYLAVKVTQ